MTEFVIVGGKARKAKGRFGGECGRNYDRSFERRHLKLTSKQLIAAAQEELRTYEPTGAKAASTPAIEYSEKRVRRNSAAVRVLSTHPRAISHNSRKVVAYPDGMRIYSANY